MRPWTLPAVALAALVLAGCRSDGGIGRADSASGLAWSAERVAEQADRDAQATAANVARLGAWLTAELEDPLHGVARTWRLYTTGTTGLGDR